jgi:hypothetical protein
LFDGGHQAQGHSTRQPKTEFLQFLGVQAQQQAVLPFIVVDRQLMNVHVLILGNSACLSVP